MTCERKTEVEEQKSSGLDIELGLDVLVERDLIYISNHQCVIMHHLLQQMGQEVFRRQPTHEPGKRQFLVDANEIYDVLADNTGTGAIVGISFNMSEINELSLNERAFSGMHNLQILRFYRNLSDTKARLHLDEDLVCLPLPRKLRLLHWEACPMKCMPRRFYSEFLVEILMLDSKLKKLWEGAPTLSCLKRMCLSNSIYLEEVPDLSNAPKLEELNLKSCEKVTAFPHVPGTVEKLHLDHSGITEIPEWIENIYSLRIFSVTYCKQLLDISPNICKLRRLRTLDFKGCCNVSRFPVEIFQSFFCSHELSLNLENISWNSLPTDTHEREHTFDLELFMKENDFQSIPLSFQRLSKLRALHFDDSKQLEVLPELPNSMEELTANNCVSLEKISDSSHTPKLVLSFINCSKLNQEARKLLIEKWSCGYAILPGSQVPNYFTHQARGSSLTVHLDPMRFCGFLRFKACVVLPYDDLWKFCGIIQIWCSIRGKEGGFVYEWPRIHSDHKPEVDHLVIFNSYHTIEESMISNNRVVFNFRCYPAMIQQCGIKLLECCPCEHNIMGHPVVRTRPLNGWISLLYRQTFLDYGTDSSEECVDSDADTDEETEHGSDSEHGIENNNESGDDDVVMGDGTENDEEFGVINYGKGDGIEYNVEFGVSDLETTRIKKRKRLTEQTISKGEEADEDAELEPVRRSVRTRKPNKRFLD